MTRIAHQHHLVLVMIRRHLDRDERPNWVRKEHIHEVLASNQRDRVGELGLEKGKQFTLRLDCFKLGEGHEEGEREGFVLDVCVAL